MPKAKRVGQLTLLGRTEARIPASPAEARLETFPNPAPRRNYRIHFETDDFTSVCPVTGQPDFARIDIDYVPDRLCVESKSLNFPREAESRLPSAPSIRMRNCVKLPAMICRGSRWLPQGRQRRPLQEQAK